MLINSKRIERTEAIGDYENHQAGDRQPSEKTHVASRLLQVEKYSERSLLMNNKR